MKIKEKLDKRAVTTLCVGVASTALLMITLYVGDLGENGANTLTVLVTVAALSFCSYVSIHFAEILYDRSTAYTKSYGDEDMTSAVTPPLFASLVVWTNCLMCGLSGIPVLLAGPCGVKFFAWHVILTVLGISGTSIILGKLALKVMELTGISLRTLLKLVFSKMSRDEIGDYLEKINEGNVEPNPDAGNSPR